MQTEINKTFEYIHNHNGDLADIRDVAIDTSLPLIERMKSYLQQIKNPYLYKCGGITVRVSFAETETTLEERIKQLLMSPCSV